MNFKVRTARKKDCKDVSRMIMELAMFGKIPEVMTISHEDLERDGFCQNPAFECLVAEVPEEHKSKAGFTIVGYALYSYIYSGWNGRAIHLENLYVMQEFRGNDIGKSLLSRVAEMGTEKKCAQLQLCVWEWNCPAKDFYAARGALNLTERSDLHIMCFEKQNMEKLAKEAPKDQSFD